MSLAKEKDLFKKNQMKQKEYYQFLQLAIPLFSYLALVQIWEQYNYIQMRNYYTLVHIMLSCEVM